MRGGGQPRRRPPAPRARRVRVARAFSAPERSPERGAGCGDRRHGRERTALGTKGPPCPPRRCAPAEPPRAERTPAAADAPPPAATWFAHGAACRAHWRRPPWGRGRASRSANGRRRGPRCDVTRCRAGSGAEPGGAGAAVPGGATGQRRREPRAPLPRGAPPLFPSGFPLLSFSLYFRQSGTISISFFYFISGFFSLFCLFPLQFSFFFPLFPFLFAERVLRFLCRSTLQRHRRVPHRASPSHRHPLPLPPYGSYR